MAKKFIGRVIKENLHSINENIQESHLRLVGENTNNSIMDTADALKLAYEQGLDLVVISPNAEPPVAKIMDYKKFLYEQKKKQKEIKANATPTVVKEIRFGPNTDDHDYAFKLKNARSFLEDGAKVKVFVFFRGRTIVFKERGEALLLRFIQEITEDGFAKVDQMPVLEGKKMIIMLSPGKIKK
ncbi:MAG: translation initiation factor IF-3 [Bacteroidia bacterium]|nr:translation initiation factor IF-3 [Bacteroidia bacterium]